MGGMAWVKRRFDDYLLQLTDGYFEPKEKFKKLGHSQGKPVEQIAANQLHRLGTVQHLPPECRSNWQIPSPLHVWVLGNDGWTEDIPESLAPIVEGENDPSYRIFLSGVGWPSEKGPYLKGWNPWVQQAGLVRKKKHHNPDDFKNSSRALLDALYEHYSSTQRSPSEVLERLNIPYHFAGDP